MADQPEDDDRRRRHDRALAEAGFRRVIVTVPAGTEQDVKALAEELRGRVPEPPRRRPGRPRKKT